MACTSTKTEESPSWTSYRRFEQYPFKADLESYFKRIKYTGNSVSNLENLQEIHKLHCFTIPFENCDNHLGKPIIISPEVIQEKLVYNGRGGYCFEQNTLFFYVLLTMGYNVIPILTRSRWGVPKGFPMPATHLIVRAEVDGKYYICDLGYCNGTPIIPVEINSEEQKQSHDDRRVIVDDSNPNLLVAQLRFPGSEEWVDCYDFRKEEVMPIDIDLSNWWTSTSPKHKFTRTLVVTITQPACRYVLADTELTARYIDGRVEKETISANDICHVLASKFGIHFPDNTKFKCIKYND